jgi:dsDNA-specific endonuclease/ATPase MutS2
MSETENYQSDFDNASERYDNKVLRESLKQLEFRTVLEFISKYAYSDLGSQYVLHSMPVDNIEFLNEEHSLIEEMRLLVLRS